MKRTAAILLAIAFAATCFGQAAHPEKARKAPAPDTNVLATILGQDLTAADQDELDGRIFGALLEKFAAENHIAPTDAELDAFVAKSEEQDKQMLAEYEADVKKLQQELQNPDLGAQERQEKQSELETTESILKSLRETAQYSPEQQEQAHQFQRELAQQFVLSWKINKALYEKYGGRVIFQQAGPEPLDAYRDFLKDQEKQGAFQIPDKKRAARFWNYFTNETMHTFYSKEDGDKLISTPWWLMEPPAEDEE